VSDRVAHDMGDVVIGKPVDHLAAPSRRRHEAGALEHLEVLGDERLRGVERTHELVHAPRRVRKQINQREPDRRDERLEQRSCGIVGGRVDLANLRKARISPDMLAHAARPTPGHYDVATRPGHTGTAMQGCRGGKVDQRGSRVRRHRPNRAWPETKRGFLAMPTEVQGVIARSKGAPVEVTTIVVPDPGPGEALVDVKACGVCHTDLHYREGGINDDFPFLLGHEAAGVVSAVGEGVTDVAPGDFVILNWRAVCGHCRACARGEPWYCFSTHNASQRMTLTDGTPLSPALGIGAFATKTLVAAGQCTKVNPGVRPEVAGLLGCGVMAGLGAALNTAAVRRGESVAVIGCGGVGDAAILGASIAGARTVIAIDLDDRKLEWARGFGATDTINSRDTDLVEGVQALTGGNGADVVIDAVARPETYTAAFYARDLAGRVVLVGVPTPDMRLELPLIDIFGRGGSLKSSWYGDCLPSRDFPMLVDLHLSGRLPLEKFVSETIGINDVEAAFDKMHKGEVLRSVVVF
jgi:S-(hydroxymethyl)mycothiol dehydrogenase